MRKKTNARKLNEKLCRYMRSPIQMYRRAASCVEYMRSIDNDQSHGTIAGRQTEFAL